ncbi:MAG: hypothetical protein IPL79_07890 [Myxococcales bacterium]|nr:hypothetical protein [Myxococcales bacterium]
MLAYQARASDAAWAALGEKPVAQAPRAEDKPKALSLDDWESIKSLPTLKETLDVGGVNWVMVDQLDILAKDSEARHQFAIKEAKDSYRSRQRLKYPDGTVVEDTGRAHVGGWAEYKLLNLQPGRPVVILRRMDYVYGDYELDFQVNGKSVAVSSCTGTDRVNRWRNWPVLIPAEVVTESTLLVRQLSLTAGRDVNMFQIWAYQPK